MNVNGLFEHDRIALLSERLRGGTLSRRDFHRAAALLLGAVPFGVDELARADTGQLVLVNWGGEASDAYDKAYGQPFYAATGIRVRQDTSGPSEGSIAAQYESGHPSWDVIDADPFTGERLGKRGMIEPIDYAIVDRNKMRKGFGWQYAASTYFYSFVLVYDAKKFGRNPPRSRADLFDVKKFPGKRAMFKLGISMWEAALLADGVPREKLYPLDLARAHAKLGAFKEHVVGYWGNGTESTQLFLDGEASMGILWSTRAQVLEQESGGDFRFVWDEALAIPGGLVVMKGNPGGAKNAMRFIASTQIPERQLVMFRMLGECPANPATDALLRPEERRLNAVDPANFQVQVPMNVAWYEENYGRALEEYLKVISS